jgi:hypothetical protein
MSSPTPLRPGVMAITIGCQFPDNNGNVVRIVNRHANTPEWDFKTTRSWWCESSRSGWLMNRWSVSNYGQSVVLLQLGAMFYWRTWHPLALPCQVTRCHRARWWWPPCWRDRNWSPIWFRRLVRPVQEPGPLRRQPQPNQVPQKPGRKRPVHPPAVLSVCGPKNPGCPTEPLTRRF